MPMYPTDGIDTESVLELLGEVTSAFETSASAQPRFVALAGALVPRWARGLAVRWVDPSTRRVIFEGAHGETADDPFGHEAHTEARSTERAIALPLDARGRLFGELALFRGEGEAFERAHLALARELASRIACLLDGEHARARARQAEAEAARLGRELEGLAKRERLFRTAHDLSTDSVVVLRSVRDASGQIVDFEYLYANPVSLRMVQRPLHDVLGSHLLTLVPGHRDHHALFRRFVRVVETGIPEETALEYDGEGISGVFHSLAAKIDDGVVLYFHDVTQEKQQELALRESERRHRQLAERYGALVAAFAARVWTVKASEGLDAVPPFGLRDRGEASEGAILDEVHPEDRARVLAAWQESVTRRRPFSQGYRVRGDGAEHRYVHGRAVPVLEPDGAVREWVGVCIDEDERRRAEEALRESEALLKLAQRSARMGVWALDFETDAVTARWSDESNMIYGRDPSLPSPTYEEWLGLIREEDRPSVEQVTRHVLEGETDDWRLEFRIHHPKLGERWILEVGHREGRHGVGISLDLTTEKRTEERLRHIAKMDAVGRLAGGLAHDFNNQLQVVRGFASVVTKDPGLSRRSRDHLAEIGKAVERMRSSTSQLLAFSRQQVLTPETIELDEAIREGEPFLERLVGKSQIRPRLDLGPEAKWVRVDRAQLMQVLLNLTLNARDAMPHGGTIEVRTAIRTVHAGELDALARTPVPPGRYASLEVADTGRGIPPAVLDRVFEPFFTTKEVGRGTGLGLATVHGIVRQSSGFIWATSEADRGTTFVVLLPLTDAPPAPKEERRAEEAGVAGNRILVVEDESAVRCFLVEALESGGYEVVQAAHGREALERLESLGGEVDLVVSDATMPVMSGPELAHELSARYPDLPIVWISGYTRETAFEGGALGRDRAFLQKPVSAERLVETVRVRARRHASP
jgi:signal transduction histidine kinase/CheY-like chemotaxis protein